MKRGNRAKENGDLKKTKPPREETPEVKGKGQSRKSTRSGAKVHGNAKKKERTFRGGREKH